MLRSKVFVGPPAFACVEARHGLGEQLIAISRQGIDVDGSGLDRPEAPAAGFVAQIGVPVGGADENALPRSRSPPCARSSAGIVRSCRVMKALSRAVSARSMACISETSISHLPRRCCCASLPTLTSGRLSENHSPPRMPQAVLFSVPCGPSRTIMWSALHPGSRMRATMLIRNIGPMAQRIVVSIGAEIGRQQVLQPLRVPSHCRPFR